VVIEIQEPLDVLDRADLDFSLATDTANSLNIIYAEHLTPDTIGYYLTDLDIAQGLATAEVTTLADSDIALPDTAMAQLKADGYTVILVEAKTSGDIKLQLLVTDAKDNKQTIATIQLEISGVEEMYYNVNLRPVVDDPENIPAMADMITSPTNDPSQDVETEKNFIFVHGYNVNEEASRGWRAEVFKRMYWSGSKARFYGVTWNGADGQRQIPTRPPTTILTLCMPLIQPRFLLIC